MSKFQLFAPTTAPVDPTGNMRIPALVWSPDAELCKTVTPAPGGGQGTVTDIYMGSERAPRAIRITLAQRQLAREVATSIAVCPGHLLEIIRIVRQQQGQNDQTSPSNDH
jgi:hypothetical protein